jgi:hypothetical protein
MARTIKAAVLTGDVIDSSGISAPGRKKLLKTLQQAIEQAKNILPDLKPEIFQGDSFQGYTTIAVPQSLRATLYIITSLMKNDFNLRISVGIGEMAFETGSSLTSDGSAFLHSGRNMEMLKKREWMISVGTDNMEKQQEWDVHNNTMNFLLKRCTALQAEVLVQMLEGQTQQQAADNLNVKQPAIQQRLQAAGWPVLQTILNRFEMQF